VAAGSQGGTPWIRSRLSSRISSLSPYVHPHSPHRLLGFGKRETIKWNPWIESSPPILSLTYVVIRTIIAATSYLFRRLVAFRSKSQCKVKCSTPRRDLLMIYNEFQWRKLFLVKLTPVLDHQSISTAGVDVAPTWSCDMSLSCLTSPSNSAM